MLQRGKGYAQERHSIASAIKRHGKRASQDLNKKAGLGWVNPLLGTKVSHVNVVDQVS
jgi:hypothetical protein